MTYKEKTLTYAQFYERSKKLAGALQNAGIRKGDKVAAFLPNIPPMLEAHFGPMYIGAAIRGDQHSPLPARGRLHPRFIPGSKALIFDSELAPVVRQALPQAKGIETVVQVVDEAPRADDIESLDLRGVRRGRLGRHRARPPRIRVRHHRHQLHVGHDRAAQGRRIPLPPGPI